MLKINNKETPLIVLNRIKDLLQKLKERSKLNEEFIDATEEGELLFLAKDRDINSRFFFKVEKFEQNERDLETYFIYRVLPVNNSRIHESDFKSSINHTLKAFDDWINLLKAHNNMEISQEDYFENIYKQEFDTLFEIVDDDAEINPFDLQRQLFINNIIEITIKQLSYYKDDDEISNIIKEAEILKSNTSKFTKKTTIQALSKVFAKIRKKSIPILNVILKEIGKELIKKGVEWGFDKLTLLIHNS